MTTLLAPVVQKVDNAVHWLNLYPLDCTIIGFPNTYPGDSDLSVGYRYPTFEQLWPDKNILTVVDLNYLLWKRNVKNARLYKILFTLDGIYSKQYSATDHIENIKTF